MSPAVHAPLSVELWHLRFGHANVRIIKELAAADAVDGMSMGPIVSSESSRRICLKGEQSR